MLYKIISVIIDVLFPLSHLQIYLNNCSQLEFEQKLSPSLQFKNRIFSPFLYKNKFTRDCILELKERNSRRVAILFSKILGQWIIREIKKEKDKYSNIENFFLIPVPQHISKTKEKGFCHTTILVEEVYNFINKRIKDNVCIKKCIVKIKNSKKLHNSKGRKNRYKIIKNTMKSFLTKDDAIKSYFFVIDDVYTTGATFKEVRRSLLGCDALSEQIFFISIAH